MKSRHYLVLVLVVSLKNGASSYVWGQWQAVVNLAILSQAVDLVLLEECDLC